MRHHRGPVSRSWRRMYTAGLTAGLALGAGSTALAQDADSPRAELRLAYAGTDRAPRFVSRPQPRTAVRLDMTRTAMLRRRITVALVRVPLDEALTAIGRQAHVQFTAAGTVTPLDRRVSLTAKDITVGAALTEVLLDAGVDVEIWPDDHAALIPHVPAASEHELGSVHGRVVRKESETGIAGATVTLKGTKATVKSDATGSFLLKDIPAGQYTLAVVALGQNPYEGPVSVKDGAVTEIEVAMTAVPTPLTEVVVTASKTETQVQDVPASVEVVDHAALQNSGAKTVLEAMRNVTGVTDASYGENFQSIQLRGLPRLGNENETVLLLIDGVPQTDSRNSARLTTMPINDVDRIEVVKGPNSALYGRTAVGGVINFITEDPPQKPEFNASLQTGAWDYVRGNATAAAPTDSVGSGYLVSWQGERRGSALSPQTTRRESSIFGKFKEVFDSRTQFWVTANYASSLGGTPGPIPYDNGRLLSQVDPSFSLYSNLNLPYAAYNQDEVRVSAQLSRELSSTTRISELSGYRHFKYQFVNDGDCVVFTPPDTVVVFPFSEVQEEDYYFNDLRLESTVTSGRVAQHLLAGVSFERNQGRAGGDIEYTDPVSFGVPIIYNNPQFPSVNQLQTSPFGPDRYTGDFYGAYLQDEVSLSDRWHLSLGLRYDLNHLAATPPAASVIHATYTNASPKAGLSYRLLDEGSTGGPEVSLYGQYARAFLPPRAPSALSQADTIKLFPENITNYEAGLKASFLNNRLATELSAFYMDRTGIPILVRVVAQEFKTVNGGEQKFSGVEFGVEGRPWELVSLFAKYAYYDGRYGTYKFNNNGTPADLTGNRVALSPKDQVDLGVTLGASLGWIAEVEGHYKSNRYLNTFNTILLPDYFVADGRIGWQWPRFSVALAMTNIFDRQYVTDGDITLGGFGFPAPPRRIVVEMDTRF
jgi:TonB-dependent siderophore receptor